MCSILKRYLHANVFFVLPPFACAVREVSITRGECEEMCCNGSTRYGPTYVSFVTGNDFWRFYYSYKKYLLVKLE